MQPTYFPWAGYFNLIAQANDFVFLDDAQLEKQSWQTRNRLILNGFVHWIIVPIRHQHLGQAITHTEVVDSSKWREKLAKSFSLNYGGHPYYKDAKELVDLLLSTKSVSLANLNESIIRLASSRLKLATNFYVASTMNVTGVRSDRLIAFCDKLGATEYLSPVGSLPYLEEDRFRDRASSKLLLQNYQPQAYKQKGSLSFHSHLSILDVVANLGWDCARQYVIQGFV